MDVGAATAMDKASRAVHGAASLYGPLSLERSLGRSFRKTSQAANSHIHKIILRRAAVKAASSSDNQFGSGDPSRVDAEMILLRKRMQELRMQETKYAPPQHWMKWEKEWSVTYASDICEFMGWLQNMLINRRPGHAIAVLVFISLSVPTFVLLLLLQFFQLTAPYRHVTLGTINLIYYSFLP